MTRAVAAAAAALVIVLVAAEGAQACSCVPPRPREQLKRADGAFVGRLLAVRGGDPADYVYRVGRVSKRGPGLRRGRRVKVRSPRSSASCGLPDARGRLYGLFLTRREGRWSSNLCSVVSPSDMPDAGASRSRRTRAGSPGSGACG